MFDSLKKKFADASGKLRNKVEDEAKEANNVELIEEASEESFDEIDEFEEMEEFSDEDEEISEEELDEMLDAALEEESEEELGDESDEEVKDEDKKEKSGFLGFLKRDKKEDSEEDSDEDLEEESEELDESEEELEEAAEEGEEDSQLEPVEGSQEIPEEDEEEKEEESKKSRRSLFRRKKKEASDDESEDEDKKEKSGGFLSFIKEKSISEDDVEDILFELELGLLEADVAMDVSSVVVESVKNDLVGQKIKRSSDIEEYTYKALKNAVAKIINIEGKSMTELLEDKVAQGEPLVVMLVGINGTGKTTTIGKLSNYYIKKGYTPVIAASDTFRAGAIEQVQYHADNLGVKLIKHEKGSDPAAVAFDAVQHARAKGKELVLFNEAIDIDGVILTKADADSKGGAALSIGYIIKKPILFLGMGQSYDDIKEYDADWMLEQIFS